MHRDSIGVGRDWEEDIGVCLVCWYDDKVFALPEVVEKLVDLFGDVVASAFVSVLLFFFELIQMGEEFELHVVEVCFDISG